MAIVSVSIPDELKAKMAKLEDVNWSAVAKRAFEQKLEADEDLRRFREIVAHSKLTEKDAKMIGDSINRSMAKRFREAYETSIGRKHSVGSSDKEKADVRINKR